MESSVRSHHPRNYSSGWFLHGSGQLRFRKPTLRLASQSVEIDFSPGYCRVTSWNVFDKRNSFLVSETTTAVGGPEDLNRNELTILSRFRKGVGRCNSWDTDSVKIGWWRSTSHEWLWCSNYGSRQLFTSLASFQDRERYLSRYPQCLPDSNSFYRWQFHFKHWQWKKNNWLKSHTIIYWV